jgi:hypothetical protein
MWYLVRPDCWRHGVATESARALLRIGFSEMNLHRMIASCLPENPASSRVLEKIGMGREGYRLSNLEIHGVWHDSSLYSILREEWEATPTLRGVNDEQQEAQSIPIKDLVSEDGAHELATSPDMQPYLRLIKAGMQDHDITPNVEEIAALPLEKRYIWRVASALKWAFADLEDVSVNVDRQTLSSEDLRKVVELLRLRPMQLGIFLKTLLGEEVMERMMAEAITVAKRED